MTDPIADMFTRIRNAQAVLKESVEFPASALKLQIAKLLERSGFVQDVEVKKLKAGQAIRLRLKYTDGRPAISGIQRVSRPGQRLYTSAVRIRRVKGGSGVNILSTSKGVLSGSEARTQKLGGEMIGQVW